MNDTQTVPSRHLPRILLLCALLLAGGVYAWGIKLGYIHAYYGPAVYSMSHSWEAFIWGSWDGNTVTLDKLPGAFWIQALSARIFGFNDWSVLLPGVIEALLCGLVVFAIVRRYVSEYFALAAAVLMLVTPILSALSHTEISDTLYTLLTLCAVWAWTRSIGRDGSLPWLLLAGLFIGMAFHAKMAQAWGILPALAIVYLFVVPLSWPRRLLNLLAAGVLTVVTSLLYILMATVVPAGSRPWIDGSTDNSAWSTVFVYNLLGRYDEDSSSSATGIGYLVNTDQASQAGWFYFSALIGLVAVLVLRRRAPRTDLLRATSLMAAVWVAVYWVAFSSGQVNHNYYVVILAPALVILTVNGAAACAQELRNGWFARAALALMLVSTVGWAVHISLAYSGFLQWTVPVVIVLGILTLLFLLIDALRPSRILALIAGVLMLLSAVVSPAAWAVAASTHEYSGNARGPVAGPVNGMSGMGGGGNSAPSGRGGSAPTGSAPSGSAPSGSRHAGSSSGSSAPSGSSEISAEQALAWVRANDPGSEYDMVIIGYSTASDYVLAGGNIIMVGGYSGKMNNYTLEQLQADSASGAVHYVLLGRNNNSASSEISEWVQSNCTSVASESGLNNLYRCN
ncbi:MAG: glycosyltransferase family 39 protein [Corynebacterium sp.]|nr:glycosyltransferase family 39 protein [Corynebacterium sp.]